MQWTGNAMYKRNRHDAYMLLGKLKEHRNIFDIASTATFH